MLVLLAILLAGFLCRKSLSLLAALMSLVLLAFVGLLFQDWHSETEGLILALLLLFWLPIWSLQVLYLWRRLGMRDISKLRLRRG